MLEPILIEKTKRTHQPKHKYISTFLDDITTRLSIFLKCYYGDYIAQSCSFLHENASLMPVVLLLQNFESHENLTHYLDAYFSERMDCELVYLDGFLKYKSKADMLMRITEEGCRYLYIMNYDRLDTTLINDILDVITDSNSGFRGILVDIVSDANRFQASTPLNILSRMNVRIASIPSFSEIRRKCNYEMQSVSYMPMMSKEVIELLNSCTHSGMYLNYLKSCLANHWIENDTRKCYKILTIEIETPNRLISSKGKQEAIKMLATKERSIKNAQLIVENFVYFKRVKAEFFKGLESIISFMGFLPDDLSIQIEMPELFEQIVRHNEGTCTVLQEYYGALTSTDMASKEVWMDYLNRLAQNYTISQEKCNELTALYDSSKSSPKKTQTTLSGRQRKDVLLGKSTAYNDTMASQLLKNEIKIIIDQLLEPFESKLLKVLKDSKLFFLHSSSYLNPDLYSECISTLAYPPIELVPDFSEFSYYEDISIIFYLISGCGKDIELNNTFDLYAKIRKDSGLNISQLQSRFLQTVDELIYTGFLSKSKRKSKKGEFWAEKRFYGHSTYTN